MFVLLTAQLFHIGTLLLFLQIPLHKEPGTTSYQKHVEQYHPTCAIERRQDGNLQLTLLLAQRTVAIEDTYTEGIGTGSKGVIGDVRVQRRGAHPVLVEALQLIGKALTVVHDHFIGR